jgi:hypothetical protein
MTMMTPKRWMALGLTLASVVVGGWKSLIPGMDLGLGAGSAASATSGLSGAADIATAAAAIDAYHNTSGTYAGATIPAGSSAQLVWASDAQFCLQDGSLFLVGPGGLPQQGSCPPNT